MRWAHPPCGVFGWCANSSSPLQGWLRIDEVILTAHDHEEVRPCSTSRLLDGLVANNILLHDGCGLPSPVVPPSMGSGAPAPSDIQPPA